MRSSPDQASLFSHPALECFGPVLRHWFERRFPQGPTEAQIGAWPAIAAGRDTLVAAPTGSGKTLAAFAVALDRLLRCGPAGGVEVVYVSPLRALAVDIKENLETPLAEMAATAAALGLPAPPITVAVRNGDTTPAARAAMVRRPPTVLVTTPESLYLLLTAGRSRAALAGVRTVIVDEIHALARDKRGAHLAVTLERLDHVCGHRPVRIGLSATQRPIEVMAALLVGGGAPAPPVIVDAGHRRHLDVALELPPSELEAITSAEQFGEVVDRLAELVRAHRTTLVFVSTRRLAERLAHQLGERLDPDEEPAAWPDEEPTAWPDEEPTAWPDEEPAACPEPGRGPGLAVAAHHGSLSKERRLKVERMLRSGQLRSLVATASLELGIDVGPVDLVCQIGTPRSIATFLQRVGRSGHHRGGVPKGRLFPLTRDDLVECAALLAAVHGGRLDTVEPPEAPLDILVQQVVAETATCRWAADELFDLVRRAHPYRRLSRDRFDAAVELATVGVTTGRGARGDHVHHDRTNGELAGRRGARLAALTSGGAIPELADYRVVADPDETFVGTVGEDWAIDSSVGDVFLLGSSTWRIRRVEAGVVRVVDADGADPTVPFWAGEGPARTAELSAEVGHVREAIETFLAAGRPDEARAWLASACRIDGDAAAMIVSYLAAARATLGALPTGRRFVVERFFDDAGGMQLVIHCPAGARINRALGLALRKRFCVTFDFELQAAASDDAVILSLGPQHSFPLDDVGRFLRAATVEDVLRQAVLVPPSPLFQARWRWNLNRALVVLRWRSGRRNPPHIQRMEADDVTAAVFPQAAACQENATGPLEIPDHLLVSQTMHDTLTEALDVVGLRRVLAEVEAGQVELWCRDTAEPSVLAHELLAGRPSTFLDDAPAEERRTRGVTVRRGLPAGVEAVAEPDPTVVDLVRAQAAPDPRTADELADVLDALVACRARDAWRPLHDELAAAGRARSVARAAVTWWYLTVDEAAVRSLFPDAFGGEPGTSGEPGTGDEGVVQVRAVRGALDVAGPTTADALAEDTGLAAAAVRRALGVLEAEGFALRGALPGSSDGWCARRLAARIQALGRARRRREIEPVPPRDFVRFLLEWQHLVPTARLRGEQGVLDAVEQLQGWEAPAASWEEDLLAARVEGYRPALLDGRGHAGELAWLRLRLPEESRASDPAGAADPARNPTRATPVTLCARGDVRWLLRAARGDAAPALPPATTVTAEVLDELGRGARFAAELACELGRPPAAVEAALWDGVARGLVHADSFWALRSLFAARAGTSERAGGPGRPARRGLRRGTSQGRVPGEGRWALIPPPDRAADSDEVAEAVAEQLLARWGVVTRDVFVHERLALPWRHVQWALRRLEARGSVRGGRFVTGLSGEQYAHPDAVAALARAARAPLDGRTVTVAACDPLNLTGVVLPGPRVPATRGRTVTFVDGTPQAAP